MDSRLNLIPKIAIVAPLSKRSGVSRAVSTIAHYFLDQAIILALGKPLYRRYHEEFPSSTKIITIPFPSHLRAIPSIAVSTFLLLVVSLIENIKILNPHSVHGVIISAFTKILMLGRCKNAWLIYDREELHFIAKNKRRIYLIRILLKINAIDVILVLDNSMKAYAKEILRSDKVVTIRLGIHPNIIKNYNVLKTKSSEFLSSKQITIIFFHGILIPRRRLEDLILSFTKVREKFPSKIKLYISGSLEVDPTYVSRIKKLVKELNLGEDVVFLGEINDFQLAVMYKYSDIFVWPCYEQTWGLAPLEAMFFEKPVIVSQGSGVSEVLNGEVAILVPARNQKALVEALTKLIRDKSLRELLGRRSHEYVANNLTYRNTGKSLEIIFSKILKQEKYHVSV